MSVQPINLSVNPQSSKALIESAQMILSQMKDLVCEIESLRRDAGEHVQEIRRLNELVNYYKNMSIKYGAEVEELEDLQS